MSEHTKTPWEIRKEIDGIHADWLTWVTSGKKGVAVCNNQTRRGIFNARREEAEANARHIVHCVNNHERLVEALREIKRVAGRDPVDKAILNIADNALEETWRSDHD